MSQILDDEQLELRATVRKFLAQASPPAKTRSVAIGDTGFDAELWKRMSGELGLPSIAIPEECGGAGFGLVELAIIAEELGRALVPSPYFASVVLAATLLVELGDSKVNHELLPGIAAGDVIATASLDAVFGADGPAVTAYPAGEGWTLCGAVGAVESAIAADVMVVVANCDGRRRAYVVDLKDAGVSKTPLAGIDLTRRHARVDLDGVAARPIASTDTEAALARTRDHISVALAAELLGVIRHCVDSTVDYAKTRVQFGRPIGQFQAVKHGCADMWVRYELAESAVRHAAAIGGAANDESSASAALALAYTSEAAVANVDDMIQFHGGIAYTWEHDAHLFYRRAYATACMAGRPAQHRGHLADLLGI